MFTERSILKITDYAFQDKNGIRDKYMIVLNRDDDNVYIIHTLTTSQPNGFDPKKFGCHTKNKISYFYFSKNIVIAENGFSFDKDTFVFFVSNIRKESLKDLNKYPTTSLELKGIMDRKCLRDLIDCMLNSEYITSEQADCLRQTRKKL
jgi:hypothetical protein